MSQHLQKAIFLDRDGIINIDYGYTYQKKDFVLVPGIVDFCKQAQQLNYKLIVVTNQSGVARGMYTEDQMHEFHTYMQIQLGIRGVTFDALYYCIHHPHFDGSCLCRKPGTLMLEKAIARFEIDPQLSYMVGDSERDIIAGRRVGCKTIFIGKKNHSLADWVLPDLTVARAIVAEKTAS